MRPLSRATGRGKAAEPVGAGHAVARDQDWQGVRPASLTNGLRIGLQRAGNVTVGADFAVGKRAYGAAHAHVQSLSKVKGQRIAVLRAGKVRVQLAPASCSRGEGSLWAARH